MVFYRIVAFSEPVLGTPAIDQLVELTYEQLRGVVAVATALFMGSRDEVFTIYDQNDQILDLESILRESDTLVFEHEPAFELNPEYDEQGNELSWLDTINRQIEYYNINTSVSKPYTVKLSGADGMFLFQYDNNEFYEGMVWLIKTLGYSPADILVYLHYNDDPLVAV